MNREMEKEMLCSGKRLDNPEWVEGYYVFCRGHHYILPTGQNGFDERYSVWVEVDAGTVGQYTGLDDKNSTRIFEGDVLKDSRGTIFVVEWEKEGRFLGFTFEPERRIMYVNREPKAEIIGNIHDNPDLAELEE